MGLFVASFGFSGTTPSMDEVTETVRTAVVESFLPAGTLAASLTEEEKIRVLKESKSCLRLSGATLIITLAADRQLRRRRDWVITVSLPGKDLVVTGGNYPKFWDAVCKAIAKLGGVEQPFLPQRGEVRKEGD